MWVTDLFEMYACACIVHICAMPYILIFRRNSKSSEIQRDALCDVLLCVCLIVCASLLRPVHTRIQPSLSLSLSICLRSSDCLSCLSILAACLFHRPDVCPGPPYRTRPAQDGGLDAGGDDKGGWALVVKVCMCVCMGGSCHGAWSLMGSEGSGGIRGIRSSWGAANSS